MRVLDDIRCHESVLFGTRFALYGWSRTHRDARMWALYSLLLSAKARGVLADAAEAQRLPPKLKADNLLQWIQDLFPGAESEGEEGDTCEQERADMKPPMGTPDLPCRRMRRCNTNRVVSNRS